VTTGSSVVLGDGRTAAPLRPGMGTTRISFTFQGSVAGRSALPEVGPAGRPGRGPRVFPRAAAGRGSSSAPLTADAEAGVGQDFEPFGGDGS
jgi:hypothetical protein